MSLNVWQTSIVDGDGVVQPLASIEVKDAESGLLVQLYEDFEGTIPLGNPFNAELDGFVRFYVAMGRYRITATLDDLTRIWEDVALGLTDENIEDIYTEIVAEHIDDLVDEVAEQHPYPLSVAEIAMPAVIVSGGKGKVAGDIRRYGAVAGGSASTNTAAIQMAIDVCQESTNPHDHGVYVPSTQAGWQIDATLMIGAAALRIYGDNGYYSQIYTLANITMFEVLNQVQYQGVIFERLQIGNDYSGTPTGYGIHFKNSSYCKMTDCIVRGANRNLYYDPTATAPTSCFSNSIEDCTIVNARGANEWNIVGGSNTNHLNMRNTTFGGTTGGGLYLVDSGGLFISGGDCESCGGTTAIDLDSSGGDLRVGHLIMGCDFENNATTDSVIRIGATTNLYNVTILSNTFVNTGTPNYLINPFKASQVNIIGNVANTGIGSAHVNVGGTVDNLVQMNNSWNLTPFDIRSTTGGIVAPRMTGTQRDAISSPLDGTLLYNSSTNKLQIRASGAWVDLH